MDPMQMLERNVAQDLSKITLVGRSSKQLVVSIPRLSAPSCHLLGKINAMGTFFSIWHAFLISGMISHLDCLVEKNAPTAFISPNRRQDCAGSLDIETTSANAHSKAPFLRQIFLHQLLMSSAQSCSDVLIKRRRASSLDPFPDLMERSSFYR